MQETTTTTTSPAEFFAGLPTIELPAYGGQWPKPAGRYLDHNHNKCLYQAFAYYAATGYPVSKWAELAGFQHSGTLKNSMNRELRKAGLATFSRANAALLLG
jgi:hypothetical protein